MKQLFSAILLLCAGISRAQDEPVEPSPPQIYQYVDEPAEFPGGPDSLSMFLFRHLRYSEEAQTVGAYGHCYLQFMVSATGDISDITVQRGVENCPACNMEAIRVVKMMPKWTPAKIGGKPVHSSFSLPVRFTPPPESMTMVETQPPEDGSMPYHYVDEPAEFPGGTTALKKFLAENIRYPKTAAEQAIEGKCYLQFVVAADGTISDVVVRRGIPDCPECDAEAVRVVKLMPDWIPGKIGGKKVASVTSLPIAFHLH